MPSSPASAIPTTLPPSATGNPITLTAGEQAAPLVKVDTRGPKADAATLVDVLMTLPEDLQTAGRPATLLELISPVNDRQQQLAVAHAYWLAMAAMIEMRVAHDDLRRLEQLQQLIAARNTQVQRGAAVLELQSRLASARARHNEAELALVTAQHTLIERAGLSPGVVALPLPIDRPHTGSYRTLVEQIYGGRGIPLQARLFDRQVPLRRDAINAQAAAVQSAHDAVDALIEGLSRGETEPRLVWSALDEMTRANHNFAALVRDYNLDIAAYALTIPRGGISPQDLVSMLIKPRTVPNTAAVPNPNTSSSVPAVVRPGTIIPDDNVSPATFQDVPRAAPNEPTLAPPRDQRPLQPPPSNATAPSFGPQRVQRPTITAAESSLYPALMEHAPAKRAQELTSLLHWDRGLPEDLGKAVTLAECLAVVASEERRQAIEAFWITREWVARYQVAAAKVEQLDALQAHTVSLVAQPGGPETMLRLRTARLLAKSEMHSTRMQLETAQARLMRLMKQSGDGEWLRGATTPHGGRYQLRLEALGADAPLKVRELARSIPTLHRTLEERAASVVMSDAARADVTNQYLASTPQVDLPLDAIQRQAEETLAFLDVVTRYNREIANYALHVLPANATSDQLVSSLVLTEAGQ